MRRHKLCLAIALALTLAPSLAVVVRTDSRPKHRPVHRPAKRQLPTERNFRQTLTNYEDLQYYGTIEVGGQKLHGVFDSGSIELVVISDKCSYWCGPEQALYHHKQSRSYQRGKLSISISYGSGDLRGVEAYDTVAIGPFHAKTAPFWEVSDATMPVLFNSAFQAIIGLGPISPNVTLMRPGKPKTNMSYAVVLDKLNLKKYSVCLMRDPGMPGYITWNEEMHEEHQHLFTELPVVDSNYWMVKLENVQLGDGAQLCEQGCGAIIDSGTSLLAMPDASYQKVSQIIRSLGEHCADLSALPNLNFKLNGVPYTLPPDSYLGQVQGDIPSGLVGHFEKMSTNCQPTLMRIHLSSILGETWILGMPFFRSYYTVFDQSASREKPRLFTAKASDECMPLDAELALTLQPRRKARNVDVSKLRLPNWAKTKPTSAEGRFRQVHRT